MSEKEYVVPMQFIIVARSREEAYKKARDWFDTRYEGVPNPEGTVESCVSLATVKERCATCVGVPCQTCGAG